MSLIVRGDGKSFHISIKGTWRSLMALFGAIALIISGPEIAHLLTFLGK